MGANRYDLGKTYFSHPLDDDYYKAMLPDWSKVKVPLLSAANWGGQPLHPRGNFEGFFRAGVEAEMARGARHRALDALLHRLRRRPAEALLRLFPQGQEERLGQAAARAAQRPPSRARQFVIRHEDDWPLPRTQWTKFHLAADAQKLVAEPRRRASAAVDVRRDGRRRHLPHRADARGDRDHRAGRGQAARLVIDRRTPTCSSCCACSRRT